MVGVIGGHCHLQPTWREYPLQRVSQHRQPVREALAVELEPLSTEGLGPVVRAIVDQEVAEDQVHVAVEDAGHAVAHGFGVGQRLPVERSLPQMRGPEPGGRRRSASRVMSSNS